MTSSNNPSRSANHPNKLRGAGILLLIAGCSLFFFFDPTARDPFLGPRLVIGSLLIIIILWIVPLPAGQKTFRLPPTFGWVAIIFGLWLTAGAFWAPNRPESFFFISRFILYGLAFGVLFRLQLTPFWKTFPWFWSALAAFLGLWIIAQSTETIHFPEGYPQPIGFSGNRNIAGNLLALLIPFSLYAYLRHSAFRRLVFGAALLLAIAGVVLSQTRSAWLAASLGLLITFLLTLSQKSQFKPEEKKSWRQGYLGLLLALAFIPVLIWIAAPNQVAQEISGRFKSLVKPFQSDSTYTSFTIDNRIQVWSATLDMIQDRPLTGIGTGNWRLVYPTYQLGDLRRSEYDTDKQITRPHNLFLRIGAENGIPGLLLLLVLFAFPLITAIRSLKSHRDYQEQLLLLTAFAGWLTIWVDSLFSFAYERPENMMLALVYAVIIFSFQPDPSPKRIIPLREKPSKWIATALAVLVLIMGAARWRTDRYLTRIIEADYANQPYTELELVAKAKNPLIKNGPVGDPLELFAARAYLTLEQPDRAAAAAMEALKWHPNSYRIYNTLGLAQLRNEKPQSALQSLQRAEQLAPGYEPIRVNLALTHYALGHNKQLDSVLALLDLQKYPAMEGMSYSLIVRQKQETLDANPMATALRFIIQQFEQKSNHIDVVPLVERRQIIGNNEQFISDYVDALYQISALYFYTRKNPNRADSILPAYARAKELLLDAKDNPYILQIIYENDHAATQRVLAVADPASLLTVRDFMFWVNAPN